jgi:1,4-alpha-glucan branching enzyme
MLVALLSAAGGAGFMQFLNTRMPESSAVLTPIAFVLVAQDAHDVALVGDFNDWLAQSTPMRKRRDGVWSIVLPLPPGRYSYAYLIDGDRWLADPAALAPAEEDFGRPSSVLVVEDRGL